MDSVKPVNVKGVFSVNGNLSYGIPVHFLKGMFDISSDVYHYHGSQFVNGQSNKINTITVSPQLRLSITPTEETHAFFLKQPPAIAHTRYSLPIARPAKYTIQEYSTEAGWQLPHRFFSAKQISITA